MTLPLHVADASLPPANLAHAGTAGLARPFDLPQWRNRSGLRPLARTEPRVLLLTSSLGAGHVRAAQAIEAALRNEHPGTLIRTLDFWSLMDEQVAWAARTTYLRLVQEHPALFDRIYRLDQRMWRAILERSDPPPPAFAEVLALMPRCDESSIPGSAWMRGAFDRTMLPLLAAALSGRLGHNRLVRLALVQATMAELTRRLAARVRAFAPDVIVATQMNSAALLSAVRHRLHVPTIGVPTDFGLHDFWIQPAISHYCVAHESVDGLPAQGLREDQVLVTGIPLMPAFRNPPSRSEARQAIGIPADVPAVLVAGGGLGLGVQQVASRLLAAHAALHVVVVTARNVAAAEAMRQAIVAHRERLHVRGWTEDMAMYMRAVDLVVGKPGGLTVAEVLACGRPLLATRALGGQEGFNVRFLERHRVGRLVPEGALVDGVAAMLADPTALFDMRHRARALGRRDGAERVAALAMQLIAHRAAVMA